MQLFLSSFEIAWDTNLKFLKLNLVFGAQNNEQILWKLLCNHYQLYFLHTHKDGFNSFFQKWLFSFNISHTETASVLSEVSLSFSNWLLFQFLLFWEEILKMPFLSAGKTDFVRFWVIPNAAFPWCSLLFSLVCSCFLTSSRELLFILWIGGLSEK